MHRKFASKKRVGIGGHELGQRRMLWGVGSAMLTALRNFLTADEVVITRTCRCHAAPGRSSRRRCKQANTTTTSIIWSLEHVISVGLLIIGECSGFYGCEHLLDRGGSPRVRRGGIAGTPDECWLLWDWWTVAGLGAAVSWSHMLVHLPDTTKSKAARGYALIDTAHLGEVAWSSDLVCRDRALAADTLHRFEWDPRRMNVSQKHNLRN